MQLRDVRKCLAATDLAVTAAGPIWVKVPLGARGHKVRVKQEADWLRVEALIEDLSEMEGAPRTRDLAERVLAANAAGEMVALVRDTDFRLVVRCDVPPEADPGELVEAIGRVARVADRWELLWTGGDRN